MCITYQKFLNYNPITFKATTILKVLSNTPWRHSRDRVFHKTKDTDIMTLLMSHILHETWNASWWQSLLLSVWGLQVLPVDMCGLTASKGFWLVVTVSGVTGVIASVFPIRISCFDVVYSCRISVPRLLSVSLCSYCGKKWKLLPLFCGHFLEHHFVNQLLKFENKNVLAV